MGIATLNGFAFQMALVAEERGVLCLCAVYAQMSTVFVEQGLTMDLSMGPNFSITSASLSAFDTIAIILLVPFYDRVLIPFLTRYNLQPSYLQRIGIGLVVSPECDLLHRGSSLPFANSARVEAEKKVFQPPVLQLHLPAFTVTSSPWNFKVQLQPCSDGM